VGTVRTICLKESHGKGVKIGRGGGWEVLGNRREEMTMHLCEKVSGRSGPASVTTVSGTKNKLHPAWKNEHSSLSVGKGEKLLICLSEGKGSRGQIRLLFGEGGLSQISAPDGSAA